MSASSGEKSKWFSEVEKKKIMEKSLQLLKQAPFYQQSLHKQPVPDKTLQHWARHFITDDFRNATSRDEFLQTVAAYKKLGLQDWTQKIQRIQAQIQQRLHLRQQQQQQSLQQRQQASSVKPSNDAASSNQNPVKQELQNPSSNQNSPQALYAKLMLAKNDLHKIIKVFTQKHDAVDPSKDPDRKRKYASLLTRWTRCMNLVERGDSALPEWTQGNCEDVIQTLHDIRNCIDPQKRTAAQQQHYRQMPANQQQQGGIQQPASNGAAHINKVPQQMEKQPNRLAAMSGTVHHPNASPSIVSGAGHFPAPPNQQQAAARNRAQPPAAMRGRQGEPAGAAANAAASSAAAPPSTAPHQRAQQAAHGPARGAPTRSVKSSRKTISQFFRYLELHGYNDRMEDLMDGIQRSRSNPEDSLFRDMKVLRQVSPSLASFQKRKRRKLYQGEERIGLAGSKQETTGTAVKNEKDAITSPFYNPSHFRPKVLRKTFFTKPNLFRDFSNFPSAETTNAAHAPSSTPTPSTNPSPAPGNAPNNNTASGASSANASSVSSDGTKLPVTIPHAGHAPDKRVLLAPPQLKILENYARQSGFQELVDPTTGHTYYEYSSTIAGKCSRKLKIFLNHTPDYSLVFGTPQVVRLVESIKVPAHYKSSKGENSCSSTLLGSEFASSTETASDVLCNYIWKDQEIILNFMNTQEFIASYQIISNAVDLLRMHLCNDVTSLMESVELYNLTPKTLGDDSPAANQQDTEASASNGSHESPSLIASAHGVGCRNDDIAVELRTYHFGSRYTRPVVECRVLLKRIFLLPTLTVELDFSSPREEILHSFPVKSCKFMNCDSILGVSSVYMQAKAQFERNVNPLSGSNNALFLIKEWIRTIREKTGHDDGL